MTITLYAIPGSPFSWRVHLALLFKGVAYEYETVQASTGGLRAPEFLTLNPRAKVPVLTDGDMALYESAPMLGYIDERYPEGARLYPEDLAARARVRRLINEVDNYYFAGSDLLTRNLYFKKPEDWNTEEIEQGRAVVARELAFFEGEVRGDFLNGELGAADFGLYPFLAHLARFELRQPELALTSELGPNLQRLKQKIEALPYYAQTYPEHWK
ncbi:MAG: glutathione S-transferase family protein [bacterium]|nr:glutathione S-transferase family protein [bacterium]